MPNNQNSEARKRAEYQNSNQPLDGLSYSVLNGRTVHRADKWNWTHGQSDWVYEDGSPAGPYKKPDDKAEKPKATSGKELYRIAPWLKGITGADKGTPDERHKAIKEKARRQMLSGGSIGTSKTQNPERPTQATGGGTVNAFGKSFNMSVPAEKAAYEAAQRAELKRQREVSPFSDLRGGDGLRSDGTRNEDPRKIVRTNSNGVEQTGTSTGPAPMTMDDANKLLSDGYKIENPYSSNQLPTTASSPYAGKSNSQIYNPETLHQHNSDVDYVSLSKDIYGDQSGVELATRNGGMKTDYQQMDVNPGQQVPEEKINWANRSMADNSDEKVRRRSAMLDGNVGILQAMRNQEAIQGRVYAGGKHYQVNKNKGQEGENDFVEISADQARDRSWGNQTADEVFNNHLGKAKETAASTDIPDIPKDTPAMLPGAVPNDTPIDKSPFDTSELLGGTQSPPNMESIIDDDKPYVGMQKYNPFR